MVSRFVASPWGEALPRSGGDEGRSTLRAHADEAAKRIAPAPSKQFYLVLRQARRQFRKQRPRQSHFLRTHIFRPLLRIHENYRRVARIERKRIRQFVQIQLCLLYTSPSPRD